MHKNNSETSLQIFARHHTASTIKRYLLIALFCISFIWAIMGIVLVTTNYNTRLSTIETDWKKSHKIIKTGYDQNREYHVTGTIKEVCYNKKYDRYHFVYEFSNTFYKKIVAQTYCVYTKDDLETYEIAQGNTVSIAISTENTSVIDKCDSAPFSLENFSATDDGEYIYLKNLVSKNKKVGSIFIPLSCVSIALSSILWLVCSKKIKREY